MEQKKQTLAVDMDNVIVRPIPLEEANDYNAYAAGAKLLPGCLEVIEKLNNKYDLFITTYFIWDKNLDAGGKILKSKYEFLRQTFPFIKPSQYVFTPNKSMQKFDIRIDDQPRWLGDAKINLLFSSPDNQDVHPEDLLRSRIIRVGSWREVDKILV